MAGKYKFSWDTVTENIKKESEKKKGFEKDTRFWEPKKDDNGNSLAIIRFIPDRSGNPFIKYYSHSFKYQVEGAVKYWIKNCINTFGYDQDCPVCKKNMELYNSAYQSDKDEAGRRKRKLNFISNIYVVKNPNDPETEGKVYLYRFGVKIYDKIKALMFPSEQDLQDPDFNSFVPFDLYEGADFKLKMKKIGDFPNYDDSSFGPQKELGDDKKIDKIMSQVYDLDEFLKPEQFPTNAETIKALGPILGIVPTPVKEEEEDSVPFDMEEEDVKPAKKATKPAPKKVVVEEEEDEEIEESSSDEDLDDDVEFFKNLK